MTDETVPCPDCEGDGKYTVLAYYGGVWGCVPTEMQCSRCKGAGRMPEEMVAWRESGQQMRSDRLGRQLSLREEANRLGVSVVELSQMERGIIEPVDYEAMRG